MWQVFTESEWYFSRYKGCNFPLSSPSQGCFLAVNNSDKFIDLPLLEENEDYCERNLFHLRPQDKTTPDVLNTLQQHVDKIVSTFVYGHQGKSKHTGVWTISELLASNSQLTELEPNRSVDEYLVPKGGVEQGLCGQIVRIFRLNQIWCKDVWFLVLLAVSWFRKNIVFIFTIYE